MTANDPLTPEEQALRDELNYRAELEQWQVLEDTRLAKLAVLAPLEDAVALPALLDKLDSVETAATTDVELLARVSRIRTIMMHDLRAILAEIDRLKVPVPAPANPDPQA